MPKTLGFWVYLQKKEEHHICMLPTKEKFWNKIQREILEQFCHHFWAHQQKMKNPYSWVTGRRKTTKYSKSGNPLDKPTKTLYFRVTTRSKPMFSKTFQPPSTPFGSPQKSNLGVQIV